MLLQYFIPYFSIVKKIQRSTSWNLKKSQLSKYRSRLYNNNMNSKNTQEQLQNVKQPKNVKVLILSESKTSIKQFYYIKTYLNLIKIDLSYNKLSSFPPGFSFTSYRYLRTLFLHYNKFNIIRNLAPVTSCKPLIYLTLFGNPLEQAKARHFIVNQMPNLMLMDNKMVKLEERDKELNLTYTQVQEVPFPLVKHQNQQETELYLQNMVKQLRIVRRKYIKANPIVRIQRWWRHLYRMKHRKWKITQLPSEKEKSSTLYDLKHYKQDLDRLITEKMEVHSSSQQKIKSLFQGNLQFWKTFREIITKDQIYFTRQYCQLNAIKYSEAKSLRVFRLFKQTKQSIQNRRLLFFVSYHQNIIATESKGKKHVAGAISVTNSKHYSKYKKVEYSLAKFQKTRAKVEKMQANYRCLVKPEIGQQEILCILRKEYFKYLRFQIKGITNQAFPVVCKRLLIRNLSAVRIQKLWRGYRVRKNLNTKNSIRAVKAATKIQRWIRNLRFMHRFKFLLQVGIYLKKERNNPQIVLEMGQIGAIESYCQFKQNGINFIVSFQDCGFSIQKYTGISSQLSGVKTKIVFHSERKPYPSYLKLMFKAEKGQKQKPSTNVLELLFKEAKSIKSVVDSKGVKYIHFTYHSLQQALDRKFILALKTYRMQNHQFVMSVPFSSGLIQITADWLQVVNSNKLVTIQKESLLVHKKENQSKTLTNQRSLESLGCDVSLSDGTIFLKVKFFLATINYSCFLIIKSPKMLIFSSESTNNLISKKEYYLGRHKSFSKRYDDQTQNYSKISRNIISLDQSLAVQHKQNVIYSKILNTDQSHSIIQSLTPQSSLQKFDFQHKFQTYDKFNREVYPSTTEVVRESLRYKKQLEEIQQLRHKKSVIDEIKESHRQKIKDILTKKSQNLSNLRGKITKEQEQNSQLIEKARLELQQRKIKKHNLIKEMKASSGNFQLEFMKKGIKSIKKDVKDVEKKCRSFRQQQREISYLITEMQKKHQYQKTEIRQFSIKISDGDISLKASDNGKLKSQNQNQQQFYRSVAIQSGQSQEQLKSIIVQEKPVVLKEQSKQQKLEAFQIQKQLKKARKKRLVHSVFPQEFYPLRQSNQIGFQLPKIAKK